MFGRFSSSCGYVGVDIGARSIKMLQLRLGSGGEDGGRILAVVGAAETSIDPAVEPGQGRSQGHNAEHHDHKHSTNGTSSGSSNASETDASSLTDQSCAPCNLKTTPLAERIRAAFTAGGFTGRRCVVSLPRSDISVAAIRLPKMPEHELRQAARWEAAERFGLDPHACEVDVIPLSTIGHGSGSGGGRGADVPGLSGGPGERVEVLVIAAPHPVLHARLKPILDAGLRPVAVDTDFCALARIFSRRYRRESDRQHVRVLLEVGYTGSMVLILRGCEIAFCKPIDIGGRQFNQAVAEHLQLNVASAAELRAARLSASSVQDRFADPDSLDSPRAADSVGEGAELPSDPATDRAIFEAVRPLLGELVKDVSLCLRYYGVTFRGRPAQRIVLTGGECLEPHLALMLRNTCKLPVTFDDESETLARLIPGIGSILHRTPGSPSQWAVSAGLSVRNLDRAEAQPAEERSELRGASSEYKGQKSEVRSQKVETGKDAAASDRRSLTSGKEAA